MNENSVELIRLVATINFCNFKGHCRFCTGTNLPLSLALASSYERSWLMRGTLCKGHVLTVISTSTVVGREGAE
jgi:hypothetical protein